MEPLRQSWQRTETGRDKPFAWRRPDPRGWAVVPAGWAALVLALWMSLGDSASLPVGLRVALGSFGLAALVASAQLIEGSGYAWPVPLTMAGVFAVVIPVVDGQLPLRESPACRLPSRCLASPFSQAGHSGVACRTGTANRASSCLAKSDGGPRGLVD